MISKTEVDVSKALDLSPLDLLLCENCGCELHIPPDANNQIICPWCNAVMDKSRFLLQSRRQKLWVSEKGLKLRLERYDEPVHCNCMEHYRRVVRFRHAIFDVYEKQGKITEAQAVGMLVAFCAGFDKGVLRLLGKDAEAVKTRLRQGSSFYATLEKLGEDDEFDRNKPFGEFLLGWLASMELRGGPGRRPRSDTLVLFMDAIVLMFCPNAYLHFLQDALRLRAQEYWLRENHASARPERWTKFWKARRAVEVSCKRIWKAMFNDDPGPPPRDWWKRVADQQGLRASLPFPLG